MKKQFLLWLGLLVFSAAWSQNERKITGIVRSAEYNEPLPGAYVLVKGTKNGAITDGDGKFTYTLKSAHVPSMELVVSYMGFEQQQVKVNDKLYFDIALRQDSFGLKELVITSSYGTEKLREEVVGSIATVKAADIPTYQAFESIDKMLDGAIPGVMINAGSTIGDPVKINIRGQGTLTSLNNNIFGTSSQPLIIIDGVVMTEETAVDNQLFDGSGNLTGVFKNPLARIAPEDIETLTVLKDAAAVGLYGADAANGVILITTKKAKEKRWRFNLNSQTGFSKPINQIKYLSGPQYHELYREYLMSQGQSPAQATANAGSATTDTNWFDLINRDGQFSRVGFNGSYANENWNYRFSYNRLDNTESAVNNNFVRNAMAFAIGYQKGDWRINVNINPSLTEQNSPNTLFSFPLAPNISPTNPDGSYALLGTNTFGNPLAVAHQNSDFTKTKGVFTSLNLSYQMLENIKLSYIMGVDYGNRSQDRFFSGENESGRYNGTFQVTNPDGTASTFPMWGRRLLTDRESLRWNSSIQAHFAKKWGNHSTDALVGLELQRESVEQQRELGTGFVDAFVRNDAATAQGRYQTNSYLNENSRRSLLSQWNYSYDGKYFFLLNLRRDESSAFGGDVNAALNYGAGASWVASKEKWWGVSGWFPFFRTRISYGVTGNSRIGSYRALGLYNVDLTGQDGYNGGGYASPSTPPNPNLSWERNYKFNAGLDFAFWDEKIQVTAEYFRDDIRDLITSRNIPLEIGFSSVQINGASMYNSGFEFSMQAKWFDGPDFKWRTSFNISTLKNEITALRGLGTDFSTAERARAQRIGAPTSAIWGVKFAGIDPATGRELYEHKGEIYDAATYRTLFDENDWEIIGDSNPDYYGGIQNEWRYKRFSLGIRASFRVGDQILIDDKLESQYRVLFNRNLSVNAMDRWQQQGDITNQPVVSANNPIISNSSKFLHDGTHLKIQSIQLGYTIKGEDLNLKGINSITFSADMSNVAYFYKEKSLRGRNGIAEYRYLYPEAQTTTFGVSLSF